MDEMHGLRTAVDFLKQQQQIKKATGFLQIADQETKNQDFKTLFARIIHKIEDMIELHQKEKAENTKHNTECQRLISNVEDALAKQKASVKKLNEQISQNGADTEAANKEKTEVEGQKGENKAAMKKAHDEWKASDASRSTELDELNMSIPLIQSAIDALKKAGSDSLKNVIRIIENVKKDCEDGVKEVAGARAEESAAWAKQKKEMVDLDRSYEQQIGELTARIADLGDQLQQLERDLEITKKPISTEEKEKCEEDVEAYPGKQNVLDAQIRSMQSAKTELVGWQNQETKTA